MKTNKTRNIFSVVFRNLQRWMLALAGLILHDQCYAQQPELIRVELHRGIPGENPDNQGIRMFFLVPNSEKMQGIDKRSSKVVFFSDNKGNDLLFKHKQRTSPYQENGGKVKISDGAAIIKFDETQIIPDGVGLVLHCSVLPEKNTTELHLKAEITLNYPSYQEDQNVLVEFTDMADGQMSWLGNPVSIEKSAFWDSAQKQMYRYTFRNEELGVAVKKFESADATGKVTERLRHWVDPSYTSFARSASDSSAYVLITYGQLESKLIHIDQKFGLGL